MLYLPDIIRLLIRVFEVDFQDTCTRLEKYSNEFGFFARLFVFFAVTVKILSLAMKNIQASLIFLARLFVSLSEK